MLQKKMVVFVTLVFIFLTMFDMGQGLAKSPPQKGDVLPTIHLSVPDDPVQRDYLGLPKGDLFQIPQIKAEVVIIEIFSMY